MHAAIFIILDAVPLDEQDVSRSDLPIHDQAQMIERETQLAPYDPAPIRQPLLADLLLAATFPAWVE